MDDKKEITSILKKYAELLKVCGHPLRLKILFALRLGQRDCVKDLSTCLGIKQPIISQHLTVLKKNKIVNAKNEKTLRHYKIVNPFVEKMIAEILTDPELKNSLDSY